MFLIDSIGVISSKSNFPYILAPSLINTYINEISSDVWEIEFPNGLTAFNEKIGSGKVKTLPDSLVESRVWKNFGC